MHLIDGQAQLQWSVALQLGLSWSPGNGVNKVYPSIKCKQSLGRRASQWGVSKGWRRIISAPFKASECRPGLNPSVAAKRYFRAQMCVCVCVCVCVGHCAFSRLIGCVRFTVPPMLWEAVRLVYGVFSGNSSRQYRCRVPAFHGEWSIEMLYRL